MAYTDTRKQNRILCLALVVLLAAAAVLIAVTGSANRKKEEAPPVDNKTAESAENRTDPKDAEDTIGKLIPGKKEDGSETAAPAGRKDKAEPKETEKKTDTPDESRKTSAEPVETEAAEVSVTLTDKLPVFSVPVNGVVSKVHSVDVPVFSFTMNDYRTHNGVDLLCEPGSSVVSPAEGTVEQVWEDPLMGICLSIRHSGGAVTTFRGLAPETMDFIKAGTSVRAGQVVAASGTTALIECGDEPHVHVEMTVNGETADPAEYMEFRYLSETYED